MGFVRLLFLRKQEVNSTWYSEIEESIKSRKKQYSLVLYGIPWSHSETTPCPLAHVTPPLTRVVRAVGSPWAGGPWCRRWSRTRRSWDSRASTSPRRTCCSTGSRTLRPRSRSRAFLSCTACRCSSLGRSVCGLQDGAERSGERRPTKTIRYDTTIWEGETIQNTTIRYDTIRDSAITRRNSPINSPGWLVLVTCSTSTPCETQQRRKLPLHN